MLAVWVELREPRICASGSACTGQPMAAAIAVSSAHTRRSASQQASSVNRTELGDCASTAIGLAPRFSISFAQTRLRMSGTASLPMPPARKAAARASARGETVPSGSPIGRRLSALATWMIPGSTTVQAE